MMATSVRSRRGVSQDKWRYLVLAGKGGGDFLNLGMQKAYGVLVPHLAALLGTKYGTIGFILSLATSLGFMTCPLVFALARRVNRRALAMTSSLLAGLAIMISAFVHSALWFGIAMVVVGTVYDVTESFDTAFISIGVFAFVSALLTVLLMLVKRFR
ncbi:uncharacterized protein [Diadema setosum]|uniref:uncharacterized protein n=1 Tax=Diadema setosum TaxID=31175 RepID=UPI003B3A8B80